MLRMKTRSSWELIIVARSPSNAPPPIPLGSGDRDFVHAFATHGGRVLVCDASAATPEHFDVGRAFLAQEIDNSREKLGMPAVVTGNANRAHVFLDRRAHNVADGAMIAEINDLNSVADELKIDRVNRAVVPVADRHSG